MFLEGLFDLLADGLENINTRVSDLDCEIIDQRSVICSIRFLNDEAFKAY
jgi:hypothetical protein